MKIEQLGVICDINPSTDKGISDSSECSFVPMEYLDEYFGTIARTDIRRVGDVKKGYTYFRNGDVIFAKITPCMENGKCAIAKNLYSGIAFGSTEFHVLRGRTNIIPEWIYYYLRQERIREKATKWFRGTAGQQRVPSAFLEELPIPLPPLAEQQRIAAILSKADRLRRLRRTARQLGDTYLQSVFLEMFGDPVTNPMGWSEAKLESLCDSIIDCPHETPNFADAKTPYACIRSSDIQKGYLDYTSTKYLEQSEYERRIIRGRPLPGDVIYCREGARLGNAARVTERDNICLGQRTMLFRPKKNIATTEFIWAFLNSDHGIKQAENLVGGSASPHINISDIRQFQTTLLPFEEQKKFTQIVRRFDHLLLLQREAERQAEHLFQSLLHRAFEGEL